MQRKQLAVTRNFLCKLHTGTVYGSIALGQAVIHVLPHTVFILHMYGRIIYKRLNRTVTHQDVFRLCTAQLCQLEQRFRLFFFRSGAVCSGAFCNGAVNIRRQHIEQHQQCQQKGQSWGDGSFDGFHRFFFLPFFPYIPCFDPCSDIYLYSDIYLSTFRSHYNAPFCECQRVCTKSSLSVMFRFVCENGPVKNICSTFDLWFRP